MSGHTPELFDSSEKLARWILKGKFPNQYIISETGDIIIREFGPQSTEEDARLIAAAPELLEACLLYQRAIREPIDDPDRPGDLEIMDAIFAAIAKTSGVEVQS